MLVRDGGIRGAVIRLAHPVFTQIEVREDRIYCGAGAPLRMIVMEARRRALGGLEFLEGIPGSIGGALRMNAGAMGSSLFSVVNRLRVMDFTGCIRELAGEEVKAEYRCCSFFKDQIALAVVLRAIPAPIEVIDQRLSVLNKRRWQTQPAAASAGCMFKNPSVIPAGKLIDELGLKGTRIGGAMVSDVHANFIVNTGKATAGTSCN